MRRLPALIAVLGLSAAALTGCATASAAGGDCARDGDADALQTVTVRGSTGSAPTVTLDGGVFPDGVVFADETVGTGPAITGDAQDIAIDLTVINAVSGETIVATGYAEPQAAPLTSWTELFPGLGEALECAREGARVVTALPADEISEPMHANLGLAENAGAVLVVDVRRVFAAPHGAPVYNAPAGLPAVVSAPDGRPGITIPAGAAPDELVVEVLHRGDGAVVGADDTVRVHYTGVTWEDGEVFDTSWDATSRAFPLSGVVPGFAQAMEGQTVGSRVLAVIPPELGYGEEGSGAVPADATLVFVIDILGIE